MVVVWITVVSNIFKSGFVGIYMLFESIFLVQIVKVALAI